MASKTFANVGKAQITGGGVYLTAPADGTPVRYRVKIDACKVIDSVRAGTVCVVEFTVIESGMSSFFPGTKASQVISMGNVMGPINVKQFVAALFGIKDPTIPADELNEAIEVEAAALLGSRQPIGEVCDLVFSEDTPFAGEELFVTCTMIKTREKGNPFTKHVWSPV